METSAVKGFWNRLTEPGQQIPEERKQFSNSALTALIIPIVVEQFLNLLVGVADTFMISHAGEAAISGVSLVIQLNNVFVLIFAAIAAGGSVVVSQYIGSRQRGHANLAAGQLFMSAAVIGLLVGTIVFFLGPYIFRFLYGAVDADVEEAGIRYMRILALSYVFLGMYNAGAGINRSMGKTRTVMYVSMGMNIVNVAGNAIGIFVLHAGVAGVAVPSLISHALAAVVMTVLVSNRKSTVFLLAKYVFCVNPGMLKRIFKIALPGSVENGLFQLTKTAIGAIVALYGNAQISANGVAQSIWALSAMFNLAMGPVFITVVGRYMGAGDIEGAEYYMKKLLRITLIWANLWNFAFIGIGAGLLHIYSLSAEAARYALILIIIHNSLNGSICAISYALASGLRAAGDARYTMISAIVSSVVVRGVFAFLFGLVLGWGVIGIAIAMVLDWSVKAVMVWVRYKSGKWKTFKVI